MYGPWIGAGGEFQRAPGFNLSDELTVFAAKHDGYLKMVGLRRETKYQAGHDGGIITLEALKQAWESLTSRKIHYHVKDTEKCKQHACNEYLHSEGSVFLTRHCSKSD